MRFDIRIGVDNAAFDGHPEDEIATILRRLAAEIEATGLEPGDVIGLRDTNGNRVGDAKLTTGRRLRWP